MDIQYAFIMMMVAVLVIVVVASHFSKNWCPLDGMGEHGLHRTRGNSEFMPGLQRADIEELLSDANRWECAICAFSNIATKPTCSLCGGLQESTYLEHTLEEVDYTLLSDRPRPRSYRDAFTPQSSSRSSLSMRGSKGKMTLVQTFHRMSSFSFHKLVEPGELTSRQRSARMRKEWVRKLDTKERPYWKRRILDATRVVPAFMVQIMWSTDRFHALEFIHRHWNYSTVLGTLDEEDTIVVLEDGHPPPHMDDMAMLHDGDDEVKHIVYLPVEAVHANRTILGDAVMPSLWKHLHQLSRLPFSFKYKWYLHQASTLMQPYDKGHCKMKVARDCVFEEAVENIVHLKQHSLCSIIRMQFTGESGLDAGAIQREWYLLVAQGFMDDASGLFMVTNRDDNAYFINPNAAYLVAKHRQTQQSNVPHQKPAISHTQAFLAAGRFIGRALLDGQMLPLHFCPVLFKLLLGIPVTLDDVESMDKTVYSSLRYVLNHGNVEDLCLTFSATEHQDDTVVEVELIDGGRDIAVTDANKHTYVDLMTRYLLFDRVEGSLKAMIEGLYEVVPPELLIPFDHKEFELILCGLSDIDVRDWKANTVTSSNLHGATALEWFWEVVEAMAPADQAKLLQYSTGSSRVPVQGFKGLTSYDGKICYFTLKGITYIPGCYPCAHACYNRIDLPLYPRKDLMEEALKMLLLSDPTGFNIE
ncbi:hypothetical protein H310_10100 [Aphanomyces invadans]|uniref:HECT-type E3 ubiquitin transferase n=1 Tax=Aphanomyces invadans TaxID=157072 RepID=A0A024TRZ9_9STRA|nr:hypothetical protein H310_10100 [Aphanomyces invadans]ETV96803.1 hypothetical protein H310_10100 [Aphanomyces invadans]|eukprot:XP_008874580.1 hypothetical protein H310_10100 [Aphanomyces invadans]